MSECPLYQGVSHCPDCSPIASDLPPETFETGPCQWECMFCDAGATGLTYADSFGKASRHMRETGHFSMYGDPNEANP